MAKTQATGQVAGDHVKQPQADKSIIGQFKAAMRAATPLIALNSADQTASIYNIIAAYKDAKEPRAFIVWDLARGFRPLNDAGREALKGFCPEPSASQDSLYEAAKFAADAPAKTVLFIVNAQRFIDEAGPMQAIWNLRDDFKSNGRSLILCGPQVKLPAEFQHDVITLDEPLPDAEQLKKIVVGAHEAVGIQAQPEAVWRAVEAVQGLSAFAAEQITAMSWGIESNNGKLQVTGLDHSALWEKKRKQIEQTPGLTVNREGMKFENLGGVQVAKDFMRMLINGSERPNAIVFIDEIEKVMAGAQGDTSGVSQDQHGALLAYMQDHRVEGVMLVGHPGSGKSALAKATGNEAGIPTITLDLGAAKGSLVGQSETQLREAFKVITAVSNDKTLWIATSNGIQNLSPELQRRFTYGPFFFDLPTEDERAVIWTIYRGIYKIDANDQQPNDTGWTGAEIEKCCKLAWRLKAALKHAAQFVVPVSQAAPERIAALRNQANGRWLSASHAGVYSIDEDAKPLAVSQPGKRAMNLDE